MFEWLLKNGWSEISGHEDGRIFENPEYYVSVYFGDGVWHLFARDPNSKYDYEDAAARGVGVTRFQAALAKLGSPPAARSRPATRLNGS